VALNENRIRQIIKEEAVKSSEKKKLVEALTIRDSSGRVYLGSGVFLSPREVKSFYYLNERAQRLNESWDKVLLWFAMNVLPTEMGLKIVIALLKIISKIFSFPGKVAKVGWDLWGKAIERVEEKLGIKIPIDGEQMWEIVRYFVPGEILHLVADEAIEVLEEMGPDEWKDLTKKKAKEQKEGGPETDVGGSDSEEPGDEEPKSTSLAAESRNMRRSAAYITTLSENRIRQIVRQESYRLLNDNE